MHIDFKNEEIHEHPNRRNIRSKLVNPCPTSVTEYWLLMSEMY